MYNPVIGEIRFFCGNVPHGFLEAKGQVLSIEQFPKLFAVIGYAFSHHVKLPPTGNFRIVDTDLQYCYIYTGNDEDCLDGKLVRHP